MSSSGLSSLDFSSDAMSENGLKPWWETIRAYVVATMLASSLFLLYDIDPQAAIHCRPPVNLTNTITADDTEYVNSICFKQLGFLTVYVGSWTLISSILVHASYSWWLLIPQVCRAFSSVRRADRRLDKVKIGARPLKLKAKQICFSPDAPKDGDLGISHQDASIITDACSELWDPRAKPLVSIQTIYFYRNLSSLVWLIPSFYLGVNLILNQNDGFTCKVQITTFTTMECTHNLSRSLEPQLIVFTISQGILLLFAASLMLYSRCEKVLKPNCSFWRGKCCVIDDDWHRINTKEENMDFVEFFSKHSTSLSSKTRGILSIYRIFSDGNEENQIENQRNCLINCLKCNFSNSLRIFLWDLDDKVFFEDMDKYRSLRQLGPRVLAGNDLPKFIEEHKNLYRDKEKIDEGFKATLDYCRCRHLGKEFVMIEDGVNGLIRSVIIAAKNPDDEDIDLKTLEHFMKHFVSSEARSRGEQLA